MSEHLKLECLLIEPIAEPDSILLGVTLNPAISLVNINGRSHSPNSLPLPNAPLKFQKFQNADIIRHSKHRKGKIADMYECCIASLATQKSTISIQF